MGNCEGRMTDELEVLRREAAENPVPVKMGMLVRYSAYLQGARRMAQTLAERFPQMFGGKDGVYTKAEMMLVLSSLRATDLFLSGECEVRYRGHVRDRKGKLVECEAYFADTEGKEIK